MQISHCCIATRPALSPVRDGASPGCDRLRLAPSSQPDQPSPCCRFTAVELMFTEQRWTERFLLEGTPCRLVQLRCSLLAGSRIQNVFCTRTYDCAGATISWHLCWRLLQHSQRFSCREAGPSHPNFTDAGLRVKPGVLGTPAVC